MTGAATAIEPAPDQALLHKIYCTGQANTRVRNMSHPVNPPRPEEVDALLRNAELRDLLEPYP